MRDCAARRHIAAGHQKAEEDRIKRRNAQPARLSGRPRAWEPHLPDWRALNYEEPFFEAQESLFQRRVL